MDFEQKIIKLDKWNVNYMIVGGGPHVILLMPGTLGTIMINYQRQVEGLDRALFTVVAWDPPGHGKSRPPDREPHVESYEEYAELAYQFMKRWLIILDDLFKALHFPRFSLLGWCGGGRSSIILAARYPDIVTGIVLLNTNTFITQSEFDIMYLLRDPLQWPEKARIPMVHEYGIEYMSTFWKKWIESIEIIYRERKGDICSKYLENVKCPTLIIQGAKDPLVNKSHADFIHKRIRGSTKYLFPEGRHDCHNRESEKFNKIVQEYFLQIDRIENVKDVNDVDDSNN